MGCVRQQPIDLANVKKVYFDTSAWNYVSKHARRAELVSAIKQSRTIVLASVISVGEVLRTQDATVRESLCSTMRELHGEGHLLERPHDLTLAFAEGFLRGEKDVILPHTGPGQAIYSHLVNPASPPSEELWNWLRDMDGRLNRFIEATRPEQPDLQTQYCTPSVLEREDFLQIMCDLPPTKHLNLSISKMRELCHASDIWRAQGATLACMIELSTTHASKSKHGKRRPGGPDMWQLVYLGVCEVFVTNDVGMLEAACRVSACLQFPRCVVSAEDFAGGVLRLDGGPFGTPGTPVRKCRVCGCVLPTLTGMHVAGTLS